MQQKSSQYILLILTGLLLLLFSGCSGGSGSTTNTATILNAYDLGDSSNKKIKTKKVKSPFSLDILLAPSGLDDGINISGSASFYVEDSDTGNIINATYTSSNTITLSNITSSSATQTFPKELIVNEANKKTHIALYLHVDSLSCDGRISSSGECKKKSWPRRTSGDWFVSTSACNPSVNCGSPCVHDDDTNCYRKNISTDLFAIRPDHFEFTKADGGNIHSVISAEDLDTAIHAVDTTGVDTVGFTQNALNLQIDNSRTKFYLPSGAITTAMSGDATVTRMPNINNGQAISSTDAANFRFNNVGRVKLKVINNNWAAIDATDGTPQNCSTDGGYICGDLNATFIPHHFSFDTLTVKNANNGAYTYLSNDMSMSASMDIQLSAKNASGDITTNYSNGLWEENMDILINVATPNTPTLLKEDIDNSQDLDFINGSKTLAWDESDPEKQLKFNFARDVANPSNPIKVNIGDISLTASASYPTGDITGNGTTSNTITFLYGRTHAPRQRFAGINATELIYFENYCSGVTNGISCDKSLLPNGINSQYTDDPRWFVNTNHTVLAGDIGEITQKGTAKTTINSITPDTGKTSADIKYDGSKFPYKATMENNASSWLIYDKYSRAASPTTKNKFEIEFLSSASSWAGEGENSASTVAIGATKTNRRTMW